MKFKVRTEKKTEKEVTLYLEEDTSSVTLYAETSDGESTALMLITSSGEAFLVAGVEDYFGLQTDEDGYLEVARD